MKIKEMQKICEDNNKKCKNCPLCLPDKIWKENLISWCLIDYKKTSIFKYQDALAKNNEVLASKIMVDYQEKERLLGIEKEENK